MGLLKRITELRFELCWIGGLPLNDITAADYQMNKPRIDSGFVDALRQSKPIPKIQHESVVGQRIVSIG